MKSSSKHTAAQTVSSKSKASTPILHSHERLWSVMALFVAVAFYGFLWKGIRTDLIYQGGGIITNFPSFYTTGSFVREHLRPGGPTEYLAAFLAQLFCHAWLGALVVTAQAGLLCLCVYILCRQCGIRLWPALTLTPAYLLIALYGHYTFYVPTTLALLLALAGTCLYASLSRNRHPRLRVLIFLVLGSLCFYVTGAASLLYVLICVCIEALFVRDSWTAPLIAALGVVIPYGMGTCLFGMDTPDSYTRLLPISWTLQYTEANHQHIAWVYALYGFLPALLLTTWVGRLRVLKWPRLKPVPPTVFHVALVTICGVGVVWGTWDTQLKNTLLLDAYVCQGRWAEVLDIAQRLPQDDFVLHAVNRALYHVHRLDSDLFRWAQKPGVLFLDNTPAKRKYWANVGVALDLGLLNKAEHSLTECLEGLGDRPIILRHLAVVNLAKGNVGTARVYLGALSHTLFDGAWAREQLERLDTDPNLSQDRDIQALRSVALERDFPTSTRAQESLLQGLLEKNPKNRMALEYLMAYYLLHHKLERLTERLATLRACGYTQLPRPIEEAVLVYVYTKKKTVDLQGFAPNPVLRKQIDHFSSILARNRGKPAAAATELAPYQDTYFYYNIYGPKAAQAALGS